VTGMRLIFEDHVAVIMRVRGLSRLEAERAAFENTIVDRLNAAFPDTPPDRCGHCSRSETPGRVLLPIGFGVRHAWLHDRCWSEWRERRRGEAIDQLARLGIVADPSP
jgi:hypothetical protein